MHNPGLPETLWSMLDGKLWHATSPDGVKGILTDSKIRPAYGDRYRNSFCRRQDCVSLFDFGPSAEIVSSRINQMMGWLGHQQNHKIVIWLEIDRAEIAANLWDAMTARQKSNNSPYDQFIHGVEACHKGPIPLTAVVSALLIARDDKELFLQLDGLHAGIFEQIANFEAKLPPPTDDSLIKKLQAGRYRSNRGNDGI